MTWFKVDDAFYDHPKVKKIPKRNGQRAGSIALWALAGSWCCRYLTDGAVPDHMLDELGSSERDASNLVAVGLWDRTADGYQYHDWEQYQFTREQVLAEREAARVRMIEKRRRRAGVPASAEPADDSGSAEVHDMFGRTSGEGQAV